MSPLLKSAAAAALVVMTLSFGSDAGAAPLSASLSLRDALSPTAQTVWWGGGYGYGYGYYRPGGYAYDYDYYWPPRYAYSPYYGGYGWGSYGYGYGRPYYRPYGYYPYRGYWNYWGY